jgi:hypothetical protein
MSTAGLGHPDYLNAVRGTGLDNGLSIASDTLTIYFNSHSDLFQCRSKNAMSPFVRHDFSQHNWSKLWT